MFGRSKEIDRIQAATISTPHQQFERLLGWQLDMFGTGVQLVMVEFKFFESPWIYGYVRGWLEGHCRGINLPEKFWKKTILGGLKEADRFVGELYRSHNLKIKWLNLVSGTEHTENFLEAMAWGLEEGSKVGKETKIWLGGGNFPSKEDLMFNKLAYKMVDFNRLCVIEVFQGAREGDEACKYLSEGLKEKNDSTEMLLKLHPADALSRLFT